MYPVDLHMHTLRQLERGEAVSGRVDRARGY